MLHEFQESFDRTTGKQSFQTSHDHAVIVEKSLPAGDHGKAYQQMDIVVRKRKTRKMTIRCNALMCIAFIFFVSGASGQLIRPKDFDLIRTLKVQNYKDSLGQDYGCGMKIECMYLEFVCYALEINKVSRTVSIKVIHIPQSAQKMTLLE